MTPSMIIVHGTESRETEMMTIQEGGSTTLRKVRITDFINFNVEERENNRGERSR